jgi:hypothetical protein
LNALASLGCTSYMQFSMPVSVLITFDASS